MRPRTSKGITDLLLPHTSPMWDHGSPSKKVKSRNPPNPFKGLERTAQKIPAITKCIKPERRKAETLQPKLNTQRIKPAPHPPQKGRSPSWRIGVIIDPERPKEAKEIGRNQPLPLPLLYITRLFSRLRSRSLSELTRQITPPTKNDHAPPPTESRKNYQSVNPSRVWTW